MIERDGIMNYFDTFQRRLLKFVPLVGKVFVWAGVTLGVSLMVFVGYSSWQLRAWRHRFDTQAEEARALSLSYEAVRLASKPFWNKPVLWRVGCHSGTTCYYEGDLNKPVLFPSGTEIPSDGHKGMSFCLVLAKIRRVDPLGIYLELLRTY